MSDEDKTKEQLLQELATLRERNTELEASGAEHQHIKRKLDEERNLLRTLIDSLPDTTIYAKDRNSKFILGNTQMARLAGVETAQSLVGKDDFAFFPKEDASKYYAAEQALFESGEAITDLEKKVIDRDGNERCILSSNVLLHDEDGNITGLVGTGRDVTELKQAQEAAQRQLEIINAQRKVLQEVSTPIIPIMDNIIIMPLIGAIDTARARDIMRSLLSGITEHRAHVIILDITGVPLVDTGVADHLNRTIQAARLKGAQTIVTGISDAVAETIVDLGIDWSNIDTLRDLQSGLKTALKRLSIQLDT